jgi:3-oxoadipate enol-lactonase
VIDAHPTPDPSSELPADPDADPEGTAEFPTPGLPPGRVVELPGRGTTFVREVAGPPGAPTVVLLHGWTANSALNWFAAYQPLGEHFRVVALDHRGHGFGLRSWKRFRLEDCADDVVALADVLGIERFVAVGYSMGGPVAQLTWKRHPDRVQGLVLCATARNFNGKPGERAVFGVIAGLAVAARATSLDVRRRVADRVSVARYDDNPLGRWAREQSRLNDVRSVLEAGQALARFSSKSWIGEVDVPTAVLVHARDATVPVARQRKLAAAIPGARSFEVDGPHDVCATAPPAFVPVLVDACMAVAAAGPAAIGQA